METKPEQMERETLGKVGRRLLPFLSLLFFVAYLDRVNVGFAAVTMNADVNISAAAYGFGAGLFFLGYFLFEVPSNILLARYGARVWMTRIMLTWGAISAGMAFVHDEWTFYALRFALGLAEAGFFPGIIYYMTSWFPRSYRGRAVAWFMVAAPLSSLLGAPVSGWLMTFDGLFGLKGWQLLFVVEGLPAMVLGLACLFFLTDRPRNARWLEQAEREWLESVVEQEKAEQARQHGTEVWRAFVDIRLWGLTLVLFGFIGGMIGFSLWLPQIVKGLGLSVLETGLVTAIPYVFAAAGMVYWGRHSDRTGDRAWHTAISGLLACVGLAAAALTTSAPLTLVMLSVAALGLFSGAPPFWSWASSTFSGAAGAVGIALVNSFGNLGGFFGPTIFGWLKSTTGSFTYSLLALAAFPFAAALIAIALDFGSRREQSLALARSAQAKADKLVQRKGASL